MGKGPTDTNRSTDISKMLRKCKRGRPCDTDVFPLETGKILSVVIMDCLGEKRQGQGVGEGEAALECSLEHYICLSAWMAGCSTL